VLQLQFRKTAIVRAWHRADLFARFSIEKKPSLQ